MRVFLSVVFLLNSVFFLAQKEFQPQGSEINEIVDGDLDNDQIPEKVIIYNIRQGNEIGNIREIQILKKVTGKWQILEKSRNAILGKNDGGVMGDPYQSTVINKGILIISHYGGSSWRWGFTDKYRFQNNNFELIGTTLENGRVFSFWVTTDINLSTGKIMYKKEVYDSSDPENGKSEKEIYYKKGLKINIQNRNLKKIKLTLPKTKAEIYL